MARAAVQSSPPQPLTRFASRDGVLVCASQWHRPGVARSAWPACLTQCSQWRRHLQILTGEELLNGKRPSMPNTLLPYFQAQRRYDTSGDQLAMDP